MRRRSRGVKKLVENSWPKAVFKKWLNLKTKESDFSADEGDANNEFDEEDDDQDSQPEVAPCKIRRSNSETLRAQYIDAKDIRICVGTWNVGGKIPQDGIDIDDWLDTKEPADVYAIGIQEVVPLNAGNIFGAEDCSAVPRWENLIRNSLNKVQTVIQRYKSYSNPSSPSSFKPFDDEESQHETVSESGDKRIHLFAEFLNEADDLQSLINKKTFSMKRLDRCSGFSLADSEAIPEMPFSQLNKLAKTLTCSERVGLAWPEQPLDLLAKCVSDGLNSFRSKSSESCCSFNSALGDQKGPFDLGLMPEFDCSVIPHGKKRSSFVRIISKQMIGIFISIWVSRRLRKHIQNLKVFTVGVGAMGYMGNKGSISVSMSIYQTSFCFICSHLSSGEEHGDELRRNADVEEIHRKTIFKGLTKRIKDHERIIWFGDLNYRINLPYERTHKLILANKFAELFEKDQLKQELKKCGTFDGWKEGMINFSPTYKYEFSSVNYLKNDSKSGKRTPAWCDRILSYGNGMKLLNYRRSELQVSDHRPVTAAFIAEVEVFSHKKLRRALTLTEAEIDEGKIIKDIEIAVRMGRLMVGEITD